jgi:hypothetical protein
MRNTDLHRSLQGVPLVRPCREQNPCTGYTSSKIFHQIIINFTDWWALRLSLVSLLHPIVPRWKKFDNCCLCPLQWRGRISFALSVYYREPLDKVKKGMESASVVCVYFGSGWVSSAHRFQVCKRVRNDGTNATHSCTNVEVKLWLIGSWLLSPRAVRRKCHHSKNIKIWCLYSVLGRGWIKMIRCPILRVVIGWQLNVSWGAGMDILTLHFGH